MLPSNGSAMVAINSQFHDGTKVPAELLPPTYQMAYLNEHWHDPNALKTKVAAPDVLAEYQEQTKSKMTNTETLMDLSEDQVLSVDEKGLWFN
jgi:hypothetical protein